MTDDIDDLLGRPLEDVPKRAPDGQCNGRRSDGDSRFEGYCELTEGWGTDSEAGRCKFHGGAGGAPEGNRNAVAHGAYAESFMDGFLTEAEQERVREAADQLGDEASAREHGQFAAAICMEQFRRSSDERFLRRYESICDKFGITPADELELSGEVATGDVVIDFEDSDT